MADSRAPDHRTLPRRRNLNWEAYKHELKRMWLDESQKLEDMMEHMERKHEFTASVKQYREQFGHWGWKKNLPQDMAVWMTNKAQKRQREEDKDTVFVYGGMTWTRERAAVSAKRAKGQSQQEYVIDLETPGDVTYETPQATNALSPEIARATLQRPEPMIIGTPSSHADPSDDEGADAMLMLMWNGLSKADLDIVHQSARSHQEQGDTAAAEQQYAQVWNGFQSILGRTHTQTSKVAYELASLYAELDRTDEANQVIDSSTHAHIKELGVQHKRSWQHVLHVVELLQSWNRPSDALAYLARAQDLAATNTSRGRSGATSLRGRKSAKLKVAPVTANNLRLLDAAHEMVKDGTPDGFNSGIETARTYVRANDPAVEPLLRAIIQRCTHNTDSLAQQRINAWTELLNLFIRLKMAEIKFDQFTEAFAAFHDVLQRYPWNGSKFKSLEVMESLLEMAAAFVRAGYSDEGYRLFRQAISQAEILFGTDDQRTVWMLISVGKVFQSSQGWHNARQWFEQAQAAAMTGLGEDDGVTRSLEAAMENGHFRYLNDEARPYKSVFGVDGIKIMPGRLHLDED